MSIIIDVLKNRTQLTKFSSQKILGVSCLGKGLVWNLSGSVEALIKYLDLKWALAQCSGHPLSHTVFHPSPPAPLLLHYPLIHLWFFSHPHISLLLLLSGFPLSSVSNAICELQMAFQTPKMGFYTMSEFGQANLKSAHLSVTWKSVL